MVLSGGNGIAGGAAVGAAGGLTEGGDNGSAVTGGRNTEIPLKRFILRTFSRCTCASKSSASTATGLRIAAMKGVGLCSLATASKRSAAMAGEGAATAKSARSVPSRLRIFILVACGASAATWNCRFKNCENCGPTSVPVGDAESTVRTCLAKIRPAAYAVHSPVGGAWPSDSNRDGSEKRQKRDRKAA